jgi:type I restriction-modification system DNA methylase subunit
LRWYCAIFPRAPPRGLLTPTSYSNLPKASQENNVIKSLSLYGQEMNGSSWSMAKMNMFLHKILETKQIVDLV